MQVRKQECENRHFINGAGLVAGLGNKACCIPIPPIGIDRQLLPVNQLVKSICEFGNRHEGRSGASPGFNRAEVTNTIPKQFNLTQISDHHQEEGATYTGKQSSFSDTEPTLTRDGVMVLPAHSDIEHYRKAAHRCHSKECGNGEVISNIRYHTCQMNERSDKDKSKVIIIDVTARIPRVI